MPIIGMKTRDGRRKHKKEGARRGFETSIVKTAQMK
jgi:hypothetical protein